MQNTPGHEARTVRPSTVPGLSCASCRALYVIGDRAWCMHPLRHPERFPDHPRRLGEALDEVAGLVCEIHNFGRGVGAEPPADATIHRLFLDARERLYEAIVDPNVADRARLVEWISQPLPEAP